MQSREQGISGSSHRIKYPEYLEQRMLQFTTVTLYSVIAGVEIVGMERLMR